MDEEQIKAMEARVAAAEAEVKQLKADAEKRSKEAEEERTKAAAVAAGGGAPSVTTPRTRSGSSFESKALTSFGVTHVKDLLGRNVCAKQFAHVPMEYKQAVLALKENVDIARYIAQIFYGAPLDKVSTARGNGEKGDTVAAIANVLETPFGKEVAAQLKAFGTGVSGAGAEWIPTAISSAFIEEFQLERRVAGAFREMPMPTNPYKLTVQRNVTVARIATENVAMTGTNFGTTTIDFDATKLSEFYVLPEELNEDSAPAILAIGRQEVGEAQIRARETAILNGDDSVTHQDNDVATGAADDARHAWKGLRKLSIANAANGGTVNFGSAVSKTKLDEMRTNMGKFGINVRDLAWIFGPTGYHQAVNLDEVTTVEKFGPQATILNGALAAFRGIPIMISEFQREDVAATGVNTVGGPNTTGTCTLVHLGRFWLGMRRPIRVRVQQDMVDHDRWLMASYSRSDFKGHAQSATETSVVTGINITV